MNRSFHRVARARRLGTLILASALLAACGGSDANSGDAASAPAGRPIPVADVRAQVRQYGQGGAEKDMAGEQFHAWGAAAHPALGELIRDPSLEPWELDQLMMIVSVYAPAPEQSAPFARAC